MAYRFNGGRGAVTCDECDIIIDSDLSFQEYKENYGKSEPKTDYCWKCRGKHKKEVKA